jgi:YegS/Rv2252/BmrU family lipid kinase
MRAVVVINPISGPRRHRPVGDCIALARDVFRRHGVAIDVRVTTARGDARAFSEQARADGAQAVVAWGGDGTINEVASGIAFSEVALGIVPGGSGNGLARDLGVPLDAPHALEIAATGRRRRIDGGQLDAAMFFNVAGIGLDALIAQHLARPDAQRGLSGYVKVTFGKLPFYRAQHYEIVCEGQGRAHRALFIALANSRQYGNGAQIAPSARLDDGRLDLVVVEAQPLWRIVRRLPDLFRGTLRPGRGLAMQPMTEATIRARAPIAYHVDGEPGLAGSTVEVRVRPAALSVIVPTN